jgi:hypothetical protein
MDNSLLGEFQLDWKLSGKDADFLLQGRFASC